MLFRSWTAPTDHGGASILGYVVTSAPEGKLCSTSGATTCTMTGLTGGVTYSFSVRALNVAGFSTPSGDTNEVTPTAPVLRAATANRSARLTWSGGAWPSLEGITTYQLQRSTDGGVTWKPAGTAKKTATAATVKGLKNGTAYRFRIRAMKGKVAGDW